MAKGRTRNYVSILYPESAIENWLQLLRDEHIPCLVSPLHDRDINDDGTLKKPHYHVMLLFESVKTQEQAQEIYDMIGAVRCQPVRSYKAQVRYLCHLDDLDKAQYDPNDVKCLSGADYSTALEAADSKYEILQAIIAYCQLNNITAYSDLIDYCISDRFDWFKALCSDSSNIVDKYIRSYTWKLKEQKNRPVALLTNDGRKYVDLETGESVPVDEAIEVFGY